MKRRVGIFYAFDKSVCSSNDKRLLRTLAGEIDGVKIGLEAETATDLAIGWSVANTVSSFCLSELGLKVFRDQKVLDIDNTTERALFNIGAKGSKFVTVHATASDTALEAAALMGLQYDMTILAVTVLTDIDEEQCKARFVTGTAETVVRLAKNAEKCGIRGFVCSAKEAPLIRDNLPNGDQLTIVTPAVRPLWYPRKDGQKRIVTPTEAARAGVDYIVVGRPIASAEDARRIREELDAA